MPTPVWLSGSPYNQVPDVEDDDTDEHHELMSHSEPESHDHAPSQRPIASIRDWILYITCVAVFFILLILVTPSIHRRYVPGSFLSPSPLRTLTKTHIARDKNYETTLHTHDHYWDELMGEAEGVIRYEGMEKPVGMGMFHQLHCLKQIRTALQHSQEGRDIGFDMESNMKLPDDVKGHWAHCFDYLRQIILCMADDQIQDYDPEIKDITAYGPRMCRNPQRLYDITACGTQGCEGNGKKPHTREDFEMQLKDGV